MADVRPTATVKPVTSVQAKKSNNSISWLAPLLCIIAGYVLWRFGLGADSNFTKPAPGFFWPSHEGPKTNLAKMYEGGIIVPLLIGCLLTVLAFVIERFLTIAKAGGTASNADFIRKVQYHLANKKCRCSSNRV